MSGPSAPPRVVVVVGSERPDGDTAAVAEWCREPLRARGVELDVIRLAEHTVLPCGACGSCNTRTELCALQDDVAGLVERMSAADGIIYAAPVHGFGLASTLQTFVERAGVGHLRFHRPLADKVGGVIVVGRRYSHMDVVAQLHHNMLLNRMVLVGSGFPPIFVTEGGRPPLADTEGVRALGDMLDRMCSAILLFRDHARAFGTTIGVRSANERAT